jgi:hypothetical protein
MESGCVSDNNTKNTKEKLKLGKYILLKIPGAEEAREKRTSDNKL